jgi:hypothetical protein
VEPPKKKRKKAPIDNEVKVYVTVPEKRVNLVAN